RRVLFRSKVVAGRGEPHLDEGAAAAVKRMRRGVRDRSRRFVRRAARVNVLAGRGDGVAVEEQRASLRRAAILAARDDFLPGIAALLEVDAADELEVDHLRDEAIDGCRL